MTTELLYQSDGTNLQDPPRLKQDRRTTAQKCKLMTILARSAHETGYIATTTKVTNPPGLRSGLDEDYVQDYVQDNVQDYVQDYVRPSSSSCRTTFNRRTNPAANLDVVPFHANIFIDYGH